jgi:hypothetical protein
VTGEGATSAGSVKALAARLTLAASQDTPAVQRVLYKRGLAEAREAFAKAASLDDLCALYDALRRLLWVSASGPASLRSFNPDVATPFVRRALAEGFAALPGGGPPPPDAPLRVAYLDPMESLTPDHPGSRLVWSAVLGHRDLHGVAPRVYALHAPGPDVRRRAARDGVEVIDLSETASPRAQAEALVAWTRADGVDTLVSATNRAVATLAFLRRAAPIQAYLETGFAPWRIPNLDRLLAGDTLDPLVAVPRADWATVTTRPRHASFLTASAPPAEVAAFRGSLGDPPLLYGIHGPLDRVTDAFLDAAVALLRARPEATVFIGGPGGDPARLLGFLNACDVGHRLFIAPQALDDALVADALDIVLDTFPFHGEETGLMAQARGKPVVWLAGPDSGPLPVLSAQRDALLRADNPAHYARLAAVLAEPAPRAEAGRRARAIAQGQTDCRALAAAIEAGLRANAH